MALYISDPYVNELALEYQRVTGSVSKTEAVRHALQAAFAVLQQERPLLERIEEIQELADKIGKADAAIKPKILSDEIWEQR